MDIALRSQRKSFNSNQIDPAVARAAFLQGMSPVLFAQQQVVPSFAVPAPIANPRMPRFGVTIFARFFSDRRKLHYLRWIFEVLALLILGLGPFNIFIRWFWSLPEAANDTFGTPLGALLILVVCVFASSVPLFLSAVCGFMLSMAGWDTPP